MIHEKVQDRIKVAVLFDEKSVLPKTMKWGRHVYRLTKVLNVHSTYNGREHIHFFSVATETEFFRLEFHTETLEWFLVEHYQE